MSDERLIQEAQRFLDNNDDSINEGMIDKVLADLKDRAEYAIKSNMSYGDHDILLNIYKFIAEKKYRDATKLYMTKFKTTAESAAKHVMKMARHQEDTLRNAFNKRA